MSSRIESHRNKVRFTLSSDSEDDVSITNSNKPPVWKPAAPREEEEESSMDLMSATPFELSQLTNGQRHQSIQGNTSHAELVSFDLGGVEEQESAILVDRPDQSLPFSPKQETQTDSSSNTSDEFTSHDDESGSTVSERPVIGMPIGPAQPYNHSP